MNQLILEDGAIYNIQAIYTIGRCQCGKKLSWDDTDNGAEAYCRKCSRSYYMNFNVAQITVLEP